MNKTAILLGSKPGSVVALLHLLQQGWNVKEVVASPDQASWLPSPSLFQVAKKFGIRTVTKQAELESSEVDLVISYMCRALVKKETLERGKYALNFHAGPLPEFGGWAFYNVAILEDSPVYGCTCHIMDEGFDTGPLVNVRRFHINPRLETALTLEKKAQNEMILLFREVIAAYEFNGFIHSTPQDPAQMRYMKADEFAKLKQIPRDASPEKIDQIARAFWYPPYQVAYYELPDGTKLEVIPEIAKNGIAQQNHQDDLEDLLRVLGISLPLLA
jgi:methionyl-tRNA formyltransferase